MLLLFTVALLLAPTGLAQYCDPHGGGWVSDEGLRAVMRHYGISDPIKLYRAEGAVEIKDLTPIHEWLSRRFDKWVTRAPKKSPLLVLGGELQIDRKEHDRSWSYRPVSIRISLAKTFDDAEKCAALSLTGLSLPLIKGSYSGKPIGDWTARGDKGYGPDLAFGRRNAVVRLRCSDRVEVAEGSHDTRWTKVRRLTPKCEDLARDIDAQLRRLP